MISVVMAVYNGGEFLPDAIKSILNQTYTDFEFIIVNDGSTDSSLDVIKRYEAQDERIKLIDLEQNEGFCAALNHGIVAATRPWIARMDADDISLPERFERQMAVLEENPDIIVLGTYISHMNSKNEVLSVNPVGPTTREEMYDRIKNAHPAYVMHGTVIMKKEIVDKVGGYDVDFISGEDIELFGRMVKHGVILSLPESLYLYRLHGNSMSMTRMFTQKMYTDYVQLRYELENAGEPVPTLQEFLATERKQPFIKRLRKRISILRALYYRQAGMAYGEKQWIKAVGYFALSALFDPVQSITRVWKQLFSSASRRQRARLNSSE